jgi:hypothetical protein
MLSPCLATRIRRQRHSIGTHADRMHVDWLNREKLGELADHSQGSQSSPALTGSMTRSSAGTPTQHKP